MAASTAIDRRLWVEDDVAARCHACAAQFSLFLRRHHCRRCGMAFCADCSPDTYPLASSHVFGQVTDERVCRRCCSALQEERGKQLGRSRSGEAAQPAAERQQRNRHWEKDVLGHPRSAATDPPAQQRAEAHADAERQRRAAKLERDRRAAARLEAERVRMEGEEPPRGGSSAGSYVESRDQDVDEVLAHLQELQDTPSEAEKPAAEQLALPAPSKSKQRRVEILEDGGLQVAFIADGPLGLSLGGKLDAARPTIMEIIPSTIAHTVRRATRYYPDRSTAGTLLDSHSHACCVLACNRSRSSSLGWFSGQSKASRSGTGMTRSTSVARWTPFVRRVALCACSFACQQKRNDGPRAKARS